MFGRVLLLFFWVGAAFCSEPKSGERPLSIVIFGATGDLAAKKIFPALSHLAQEGSLPKKYSIIGVGRRSYSHEDFRETIKGSDPLKERLFFAQVDFEKSKGYERLEEILSDLDQDLGSQSRRIYFLATQERFFAPIVQDLRDHDLIARSKSAAWTRVLVEKPFGHDLESAEILQKSLSCALDERQIYRIDHYLEKEGVKNLLLFRQKGELEPLWNKQHIDHVQITMSEEIGIGTRASFWEETGLLRDVIQNHLLMVLSLIALDLSDQDLAQERSKLIEKILPIKTNEIIRGQYGPWEQILGYTQEKGVPASSDVETFVAAKLWIDHERWQGVPFYIRAGKRLASQLSEVAVFFKNTPTPLVIRIQPNPAVIWQGQAIHASASSREAYEALILDCMNGDQSRFVKKEEQFAAWRLMTPVLQYWQTHPPKEPFPNYAAGTWGPEDASLLLTQDGRKWHE